jgi:integrase
MGANWIGTWDGGRVREVNGKKTWVIERRVGSGVRRVISLNVRSEDDARAELALFTRNPLAYQTQKQAAAEATAGTGRATLDGTSLAEFLAHARAAGLTEEYVEHVLHHYLSEWALKLGRRDISAIKLTEIKAILGTWTTARHKRIIVIKSFTAWLREEGRLDRAVDPTLDLTVPQAKPEQSVRAKGYTMEEVQAAYAVAPSQLLRDVLCLRCKTGMHDTEIARIARGQALLKEINDPCGIAGTVTFKHLKAGMEHTISLDAQTFAAAGRIQARGSPLTRAPALLMCKRIAKRLQDACTDEKKRSKIRSIAPGELRHSFATWASKFGELIRPTNAGLPVEEVAAVMGHKSTRTTAAFYKKVQVPPMIKLPLCLVHSGDPALKSKVQPRDRSKAARSSSSN